jgi:uncharacterized protein YjbI with pentapeptide repeats
VVALESLFAGAFSAVANALSDAAKEKAASLVLNEVLEKLSQDSKNTPLVQFVEKVDKCLQDASTDTDIPLPELREKRWRVDWITKFFDWRDGPPAPVSYLPHFGPIEQLRLTLEPLLMQRGASRDDCDRFFLRFHKNLGKLTGEPWLKKAFKGLRQYDLEKKLNEHLDRTSRLREFRMNAADPPLFETFIEPRGVMLKADEWESHCELPEDSTKAAKDLLNDYFDNERYRNDSLQHPVLFIGADFGIGKSSFTRMLAAEMARDFLRMKTGFVPVFFPLKRCGGDPSEIRSYLRASGLLSAAGPKLCLFLDALDESGQVESAHVERMWSQVADLEELLPPGTRFVITSRLILGPTGKVADVIRNKLNGMYLRVLGFSPAQVEQWFEQLGANPGFEWAMGCNLDKLQGIGLTEEEYGKPLYLWMISALARQGDIDPTDMTLPMGRTGLYLLFMNLVSRSAKPVKAICEANPAACGDEGANKQDVMARHILQQLAAIRNLTPQNDGLSDKRVMQCLDKDRQEIYRELGGERFLALSYFGHARDRFEFTHLSFKEFLLAEYLLGIFLQAAVTDRDILDSRVRLCIGKVSTEAADFLRDLAGGLAVLKGADNEKWGKLLHPFLKAVALNCRPLDRVIGQSDCIERIEELIQDAVKAAARMFQDDRPIFLVSDEDEIKPKPVLEKYCAYTLPYLHMKHPVYQDRWLSLLVGKAFVSSKKEDGAPFPLRVRNMESKNLFEVLIAGTSKLPTWGLWLLEGADLSMANLTRANLTRADLTMANLTKADLTMASLTRANLTRADLTRANLIRADLIMADLTRADLTRADLNGADLTRADLTRADLTVGDLCGANLSRANLSGADFTGTNLSRANLTGANLTGANLSRANLTGTNLTGTNLNKADFKDALIMDDDQKDYARNNGAINVSD